MKDMRLRDAKGLIVALPSKPIYFCGPIGCFCVPLTKGSVALIDQSDVELISKIRWRHNSTGYATNRIHGDMHRVLLGKHPDPLKKYIDHINGDPLDNRRANLRFATAEQNGQNKRHKRGTVSDYKGVFWRQNRKRWIATINGKYISMHESQEDAALAYNREATKKYGQFARLNVLIDYGVVC